MNWFLVLFLMVSSVPVFGSTCSKTIITANKTDMRDELKKYKDAGWKTKGKMVFKNYGFHQVVTKQHGKCERPK